MATTARTDIHRPSAPEFDPADYDCIGVFDLDPEMGDKRRRVALVNAMLAQGYSFAGAPHGSRQCGHCGAHLRYAALMVHQKTATLLYVGETCLDNRFEVSKGEFDALRKAAAVKAQATRSGAQRQALLDEFPELAELLDENSRVVYGAGEFLPSLAEQFARKGELSPRQIEAAVRAIRKGRERVAEWDRRDAERKAAAATLRELPTGRVTVTGTVQKVTVRDTDFGPRTVMVVEADGELAGWTVDGTLPSSLDPGYGSYDEFQGRRVRFDAALKASDRVPGYAWLSRPTKAEYID